MSAFDVGYCEDASEDPELATGRPGSAPSDAAERESARAVAERLGRRLAPVVVDLGVGQPRFSSFLDWDERTRMPLLAPIAGAELALALAGAREPIRIRSTDASEPWMLVAKQLHVEGERLAVIDLRAGDAVRMRTRLPGRAQALGREPLVLAVHAGGNAIEGHVFPVTSLGADHCLIDATSPLDRGQILGPVEVIGERRIIRRASGRVIEVIPWITPQGHRRFRCRLALEDEAEMLAALGTGPVSVPSGYDLLADAERIARLFDLGSMLGLQGWVDAPGWKRGTMRIGEIRDRLITLELDGPGPPEAIPHPVDVRLGFELFAVSYEGWVRLHRRRGSSRFEVAPPLVLRRCRRRRERRASLPERLAVTFVFRNTATGETVRRPVRDLSFGGLSFVADGADLLWRGICLERGRLEWNGERVALGDLEVRALTPTPSGEVRCHVANRGAGPAQHAGLIRLLASLYHPEAERHDGAGFAGMVELYERAGLLGDFMVRNLERSMPRATAAWRKLHDPASSVACTLLFRGSSPEPQAAFSAVRVWEKTWLVQHFGALPTADRRAAGTLQLAYVDFVMPQRDSHYMAFFVRAENARMNAFHERFLDLTGTPEAVARVTMARWMLRGNRSQPVASPAERPGARRLGLRPLRRRDEVVVSRAAERIFGGMPARALSLVPGGFRLPDTSRRFVRLGLARDREASVIREGSVIQAALLKEHTSPGVNLTWMLDAWWLIPVGSYRTGDDAAVAAAAAAIARAPSDVPQGDKLLVVPDGISTRPLVSAGFEKLADLNFYVISRSGFRRYHEYIADRYGELGVKMIRRSAARIARSAS